MAIFYVLFKGFGVDKVIVIAVNLTWTGFRVVCETETARFSTDLSSSETSEVLPVPDAADMMKRLALMRRSPDR